MDYDYNDNSNYKFLFLKSPYHYWLNFLWCLVALNICQEFLGDRSIGELPASSRFLDRLSHVGNRTSSSVLQQPIEPFYP